MSRAELDPIKEVLESLNLKIPIHVITINKTEISNLYTFDNTPDSTSLMPLSGTVLKVTDQDFILYNNTRIKSSDSPGITAGQHFGLKLHFTSLDENGNPVVMPVCDLIAHVYQFSRLYWSTGKAQPRPITQIYTERLANYAATCECQVLPEAAKNAPFYL